MPWISLTSVLLAWLLFTVMYTISMFISKDVTVAQMVLFRNVVSLVCVLPWMVYYWRTAFKTSEPLLIFIRSVSSISALALNFTALKYTDLVNTTMLANTSPLFVPFIVKLWRKKPIQHDLFLPIILGFIGVGLILQPGFGLFSIGGLFALGAGVFAAVSTIALRISHKTETLYTMLFYLFLTGGILSLPFAVYDWLPLSGHSLFLLVTMGVLAALGQFFFALSLKEARATHIAPFGYSAVAYSVIIEFLLWGQIPNWLTLSGIVLITLSGIFVLLHSKKNIS